MSAVSLAARICYRSNLSSLFRS